MKLQLAPFPGFSGREGPLLLIVMDGVGLAENKPGNAVTRAHTPVLDSLLKSSLSTQLITHGTAVGLPDAGDMGNSEVGHNALGAGRVIAQGASLVNNAFKTGAILQSPHWLACVERALSGGSLHFLGLLSDGNVHANIKHLYALLQAANMAGVTRIRLHILLDGRDVYPRSALTYIGLLQEKLSAFNASGSDYKIASGGGRQAITMDRYDANPAMVKQGYDCHVRGLGEKVVSAEAAVKAYYALQEDSTDQDIPAFVVCDEAGEPVGRMLDGDAVILTNYRGDRAMEISRALEQDKFDDFDRGPRPDLYFCSLIEYDGDLHVPLHYLVSPPQIERTMVEYMCAEQLKTFAISETQKFGHVTYFWNGNRSGYICEEFERYDEIKSDVLPFNQKPEMKAREITDATIRRLREPGMRFGRINFANGDMVGHTGDFEATKTAVEVVDQCVGVLIEETRKLGGIVLVTADHGNAEEMFLETDGKKVVKTSHSLNPVSFTIVDSAYTQEYRLREGITSPGLVNVAATVFNLMGYQAPFDYALSLIEFTE
jgi:2,3-bisphosphoglycerate-independent phosphoglycerate mutase